MQLGIEIRLDVGLSRIGVELPEVVWLLGFAGKFQEDWNLNIA